MYKLYFAKIYDTLGGGLNLNVSTKEYTGKDGTVYNSLMNTPSGGTTSIDPISNTSSVSSVTFEVINKDLIISNMIYNRLNNAISMLYQEMVDIYAVIEDDEVLLHRGLVRSITNDAFETSFKFEIADFQERTKSSIFDREFSQYSGETVAQINTYRLPYTTVGGVRKGFSIKEVTEDSEVIRVITFSGHVVDFIEMIFKLLFSTAELRVGLPYLTNQYTDFVDLDSLQEIRATLSENLYSNIYLEFREAIGDPYGYLQNNIYKPCGLFPYVDLNGKLGLKLHWQPNNDDGTLTLSENNIIEVKSKTLSDSNVVNNIKILYDVDFKENKYRTQHLKTSATSFDKYKVLLPTSPDEITVDFINSLSDTDKATFGTNISDRLFSRYGEPTVEIEVKVPLAVGSVIKVGDYVFLKHNHIIDWRGPNMGKRGLGGIKESEEDVAYFNNGDVWGAFVTGNNLGKAIDGTLVINTSDAEIKTTIFNGNSYSCKTNHKLITDFLNAEGV